MTPDLRPERINLSIGSRCWVSCVGCYSFFGKRPAPLQQIKQTVARFVELGIVDVTISGGDPLLIDGLPLFLEELRSVGVRSIKLDTVGTSLLPLHRGGGVSMEEILPRIDILSLPIDGWSEETVAQFRRGRPRLFEELRSVLSALDSDHGNMPVYINTVLHSQNIAGLPQIHEVLRQYRSIRHWNIFQYTPTDQASDAANCTLSIGNAAFWEAAANLRRSVAQISEFDIEFASVADRLGRYLLINSDGTVWMPDVSGRTVTFGSVFNREAEILAVWEETARFLCTETTHSAKGLHAASIGR